ncbi:MAG: DUF4845 domain-containing protein [Gammaproteobacteria bacterium]|nr:DUF4845 domain-containing protein [Gammaproteobacteria bacterium]
MNNRSKVLSLSGVGNRQQGASTTLGTMAVVIMVVGLFAYAVLRLFPIYWDSWEVTSILNSVKKDLETEKAITPLMIQKGIKRNLEVNDIDNLKYTDFKIRKGNNGIYTVTVKLEREQSFIGNLSFIGRFEKSKKIGALPST